MEVIEKMRKKMLLPKEELDIKDLFVAIKKSIVQNGKLIEDCYLFDTGVTINAKTIADIFDRPQKNNYGNLSAPFINDFGRVSHNMVPFGIVGVKVEGKIRLKNYIDIIKVCLETRNSLIFQTLPGKTLDAIVKIINDLLVQTSDFNEIVLTSQDIEKEDIDLLIYIGEKSKFQKLSFDGEKIYLGIGKYELFVDKVLDQSLIDEAKAFGVTVYEDENDIYNKINTLGGNYCSAIMTDDKEKAREFIANVKSSYILVNTSPLVVTETNLFPEMLLKRKITVIYDK